MFTGTTLSFISFSMNSYGDLHAKLTIDEFKIL